jgi:hypothetical protein
MGTVAFSLPDEDLSRLERLSKAMTHGNRSALFRLALDQLDAVERAERLRDLQRYGVKQTAGRKLGDVPVADVVKRVLSKRLR